MKNKILRNNIEKYICNLELTIKQKLYYKKKKKKYFSKKTKKLIKTK